jgi:hypothetical protein
MREKMDVPHTATFAEIKQHLSTAIPCYAGEGGCHASDDANEVFCCEDECLLLRVYKRGYRDCLARKA